MAKERGNETATMRYFRKKCRLLIDKTEGTEAMASLCERQHHEYCITLTLPVGWSITSLNL